MQRTSFPKIEKTPKTIFSKIKKMLQTFSQNRKYFENIFQEVGKNAEYSFS
jgi:hypothetical protein